MIQGGTPLEVLVVAALILGEEAIAVVVAIVTAGAIVEGLTVIFQIQGFSSVRFIVLSLCLNLS